MRKRFSGGLICVLVATLPIRAAAQPLVRLPNPNAAVFEPDLYGTAIVEVGGLLAVSAPFDGGIGSVHLFDPVTHAFLRTITNPAGSYTRFGISLADVGGKLLVGAPGFPDPSTAGTAYLFDPATGVLLRTFVHPVPVITDGFGTSVADLGGKVLIGSPGDDTGALRAGAAFVFDPTTGALEHTYLNPSPAPTELFGYNVGSFGGDALIAAVEALPDGEVYRIDVSTGAVLQTFANPNPGGGCFLTGDEFGRAMAPAGVNLIVGAACDIGAGGGDGSVYLFDPAGTVIRTFLNPHADLADSGSYLGSALAVIGSSVFIGAGYDAPWLITGTDLSDNAGSVIEFDIATGAELRTIHNPWPHQLEEFGLAVAAVGGNIVIGAPLETSFGGGGGVYLFGTTDCVGEAAGTLCPDDGSLCSLDTCNGAGACVHTFAPQSDCKHTVAPGKSKLILKDHPTKPRDKLIFKWKGEATAKDEFGQITDHLTTDYALCVYDRTAGTPSLELSATLLASDTCSGGACWSELTRGWKYKNRDGSATGITKLLLKAHETPGRAKVLVKGKGMNLTMPSPLAVDQDPNVVAQLITSSGVCFEATYSTALRDTTTKFKAKSD